MLRKALLGNWFEEEAYERDRKRLMQGRDGGLVDAASEAQRVLAKVRHHETPHPLSPVPDDGHLRFYAPVMLQSAATLGFLSLDLEDRARGATGWRVRASTAPADGPTRRNCFLLLPAPTGATDRLPAPADEAAVVHYGQPFFLMTAPALGPAPLSLLSAHAGPGEGRQDVFFSPDGGGAEGLWVADFANPEYREDMRDRPIRADAVLVIRHNHTNVPLASTKEVFYNDFGPEYEVCCKKFVLVATKLRGGQVMDENFWIFVHEDQGKETKETSAQETLEDSKKETA